MRLFGYPYNDLVICKDSPDYLGYTHQNLIKNRKFLLLYSYKNNKKNQTSFLENGCKLFNQSQQCQTRFKKKLYLKLKMWPVNALRLEWCYDTSNDKNITVIRLSMQLI